MKKKTRAIEHFHVQFCISKNFKLIHWHLPYQNISGLLESYISLFGYFINVEITAFFCRIHLSIVLYIYIYVHNNIFLFIFNLKIVKERR